MGTVCEEWSLKYNWQPEDGLKSLEDGRYFNYLSSLQIVGLYYNVLLQTL